MQFHRRIAGGDFQIGDVELGGSGRRDARKRDPVDREQVALIALGIDADVPGGQGDLQRLDLAIGSGHRVDGAGDLGARTADQQRRFRNHHPAGFGLVLQHQRALIDLNRIGDIAGQAEAAGAGRKTAAGRGDPAGLIDQGFDVAGQRQLHLGQLRQGGDVVGDVGGNEVEHPHGQGEIARFAPVVGGDFGMPRRLAAGDFGGCGDGKAIGHAFEDEIGFGRIPGRLVGFVVERNRGVADFDIGEGGEGAAPGGLSAQKVDQFGAGGHIRLIGAGG